MTDKYILTEVNNVKTGFLLENGKPAEIRCYEETSLLGNIYVGRVSNILNNINAAFVDVEKGMPCYYPLEDYHGGNKLKIGDLITVQIVKDKIKSKQPTVTTNVSLTGEYVIVHIESTIGVSAKIKNKSVRERLKGCMISAIDLFSAYKKCDKISYGGILRTKAANVDEKIIIDETIKLLCKLDQVMYASQYATGYSCMLKSIPAYVSDIAMFALEREAEVVTDLMSVADECKSNNSTVPVIYDDSGVSLSALYNLKSYIDKSLSKRAYMKSGAYLVIEPTEAMTVIDVNSGKAIKGSNSEEIIYKINVEAAWEIAHQLRLRNLSGIIIVDFISMKSREYNDRLMTELREAVFRDLIPVNVVDITRLGLVEMTRKKIRKPLHEIFPKNSLTQ